MLRETDTSTPAIAELLAPHEKDIGGFVVRRLLPAFARKMVGPFIFFDHMGPAAFPAGEGVDVRPHPHIGLATVTYLFEGALMHRDSLGTVQRITPGDVNWMTAGSGIVHSERTAPADRTAGARLHGVQTWIALPERDEQTAPVFSHHPRDTLPVVSDAGVEVRVIAGSAYGRRAPATVYSDMFYLAVDMAPGTRLVPPPEHEERGIYVVAGEVGVAGTPLAPLHGAVLRPGAGIEITAGMAARLMLFGGARMDSDRHIWWNFVASSRELIDDAKRRWREQRFPPVPGEVEFIPLPER